MLTRVDATLSRRFAGLAVAAVLVAVTGLAVASPAAAQTGGGCGGVTQPECEGWSGGPGGPGGPGNGGGNNGPGPGNGGGSAGPCYRNGVELPCYDDILGWFNRQDGCYYKAFEPQPSGGPEGRTAYQRSCVSGQSSLDPVWLDDPPPGYEAPPDPEEVRRWAYAKIRFEKPVIHTAPEAGKAGLVGLPVWLWSQRSGTFWGPLRGEAADRDVSVRVEAKVDSVLFSMGNGATVSCAPDDIFTAYDPNVHNPWNPDCGYVPGYPAAGSYEVVATVQWNVSWYINGEFQDIFDTVTVSTEPAAIEIDELQVVRE